MGMGSWPPFCRRNLSSCCRCWPGPWNPLFTESTSKMACRGESAVSLVWPVARKERIFCGRWSSRTVKSSCCNPDTGFPDLSLTNTSREIRRSTPGSVLLERSAGGGTCDGDRPCCAKPVCENAGNARQPQKRAAAKHEDGAARDHIKEPLGENRQREKLPETAAQQEQNDRQSPLCHNRHGGRVEARVDFGDRLKEISVACHGERHSRSTHNGAVQR